MSNNVEIGVEINAESNKPLIRLKWAHWGVNRRFHIAEKDWSFNKLTERIREFEPNFNHVLWYEGIIIEYGLI